MESGFLHWGHDISPEENQYQAGLKFAISYKKNINFVGKEALLKIKDQNPTKSLAMMVLKDNIPGEPLLLHEEPIYLDDKIIGKTTSGNYSFNFKKNIHSPRLLKIFMRFCIGPDNLLISLFLG